MSISFARRGGVPVGHRASRGVRKGFYAQGVAVLFEQAPKLADLVKAVDRFKVVRELPQTNPEAWVFGGDSLLVDYRPEVNGLVQVDVVERPWPDGMGDPQEDVALFSAWSMGHFGPCTFPGALERASQHAWTWGEGPALAARHAAFVRVRLSYILSADPKAPVQPEGTDPIDELRFVSLVQLAVASMPGALCAFNPNGELLVPAPRLEQALARDAGGGGLAIDVWTNVRMYRPEELGRQWLLFDTPGLGQLDVRDLELAIPATHPSVDHVPGLALSIAAYDSEQRGVVGPGDTATDFGDVTWRARGEGESLVAPPRPVTRWAPADVEPPKALG